MIGCYRKFLTVSAANWSFQPDGGRVVLLPRCLLLVVSGEIPPYPEQVVFCLAQRGEPCHARQWSVFRRQGERDCINGEPVPSFEMVKSYRAGMGSSKGRAAAWAGTKRADVVSQTKKPSTQGIGRVDGDRHDRGMTPKSRSAVSEGACFNIMKYRIKM